MKSNIITPNFLQLMNSTFWMMSRVFAIVYFFYMKIFFTKLIFILKKAKKGF